MTPARNSAPPLFPNPKSRTLTFQAVLNLGEDHIGLPVFAAVQITKAAIERAELLRHEFTAPFVCPTNAYSVLAIVSVIVGSVSLPMYFKPKSFHPTLTLFYLIIVLAMVFAIPTQIAGAWPS